MAGITLNFLRRNASSAHGAGACRALSSSCAGPNTDATWLPLSLPSLCVWGANTGVGKTLFSAGLSHAAAASGSPVLYVKPVQTGFPADADARLVAAVLGKRDVHGPHAAELLPINEPFSPSSQQQHTPSASKLTTLFAWRNAVSPHLAVEMEGRGVQDGAVVAAVALELRTFAAAHQNRSGGFALVETAGGVASPGPSGSLQCDLLRPLRLPGLLVGDGRLGGVSATLAAYDALHFRGHTVPYVVLMDTELQNWKAIQRHVGPLGTHVLPFQVCRPPPYGAQQDANEIDVILSEWLEDSSELFAQLWAAVQEGHAARLAGLQGAAGEARQVFWWPFTQHGSHQKSGKQRVKVVDSRAGESYAVFEEGDGGAVGLRLEYDGAASWWTQGVSAEAAPGMARAVSHAAARYGHIIFPQTAHEPALNLARTALDLVGGHWASRAFFSDNGSTAVEVALKMAFRKYAVDHGLVRESQIDEENGAGVPAAPREFHVLGLQEGYHGDTLGAMDAVAPSVFNGRLQTPWFTGRGLFLDPPTVGLQRGEWRLLGQGDRPSFGSSLAAVFDPERRASELSAAYRHAIGAALDAHQAAHPAVAIGAAIMEPVVQGAGGMRLVDPEYQRSVAAVCRSRGIPLILDEVFTGFWRLGATSAGGMLGVEPDVACYAKLLTGGIVPMSLTLASEAVFEAFSGDSKAYALLHGHSYTAHPIGCAAANQALAAFSSPSTNPNLRCCGAKAVSFDCNGSGAGCSRLQPLWDEARVASISHRSQVERVLALGTLLAVELRDAEAGYSSNAAAGAVAALRRQGVSARPLGNVVYLMVTPMTAKAQCESLLDALEGALDEITNP